MKKTYVVLLIMLSISSIKSQVLNNSIDTAISKSILNFQSKNGNLSPIYLDIFLNYFEKKYSVDFNIDLELLKADFSKINIYEDSGPLYARLIGNPLSTINAKMIDSLHQPYDSLMLRALYADKLYTKKSKFKKLLKTRYLDNEPYSISHTLIALAWLHELFSKNKLAIKYINLFSKKGIDIINNNQYQDLDRFAEMIAILHYHNQGQEFYTKWSNQILKLQNDNGTWGLDINLPSEDLEHCSIFCLWYLLQMKHPTYIPTYDWIKLTK